MFLAELIKEAKQVLAKESFEGELGLCWHFQEKFFDLPGYSNYTDKDRNLYSYSVFFFYQEKYNTPRPVGEEGVFTPERKEYLNWIIEVFPSLQLEYEEYHVKKTPPMS
jgi:hypothetical protein